jgi:hypothetical protein
MKRLLPLIFLLFACTQAPAPAPAPANGPTDTRIELEKMGAVKMLPQAPVVAPLPVPPAAVTAVAVTAPHVVVKTSAKRFDADAERAAYAKAYHNAAVANQLLGEKRFNTGPV